MEQGTKTPKAARLPPEGSGETPTRTTLKVEELVTNAGTQVRAEINDYIVAEYVEALAEGARFPPVIVFRNEHGDVLADGFHRVRAYQEAERNEIEAEVYEGDRHDALWFALGANRAHGQRLNGEDKRRAIGIAYRTWPEVSQTRIAAQVGCSHQYVGKVRRQLATSCKLPDRVVGSDGRERPATRPSSKRQRANADDKAKAGTDTRHSNSGSKSGDPSDARTRATNPRGAAQSSPERRQQASEGGAGEETAGAGSTRGGNERSRTGVTARQSARDRSNRIVAVVADDAKNLTAQEDLIEWKALDRAQLPTWIEELEEGRRGLGRLIRRLRQEMDDGIPSTPIAD